MEREQNKERNTSGEQAQQTNRDKTTDAFGLHVKNTPKGAEQMDEQLSKPQTDTKQKGDSSRYANTSDNEP